jgi:hypothetical protein
MGTQVRVVNQPVVFGWHEGQLYMQAFGSLEDDTRGGTVSTEQVVKRLGNRTQSELKRLGLTVNTELVQALATDPRGVPVPITAADGGVEQVLGGALLVQNHVPDGATWDGKTDLPMDDKTFHEMLSDTDPAHAPPGGAHTADVGSGTPAAHKSGT